ncbi:uridine kinase [Bacillus sp. FJAT-27251]|uniref:uridine kinase family protein n=1 Tax=Bacillus sp. FJAT-27251 TaxID=1684142 RepID=UPI0006A7922F|nr:uridine kinase [Bacillus sp. FJAT-27251]
MANHLNSAADTTNTYLVGIDGFGGSGKSTLAAKIAEHCADVTIVHMDDFYLPSAEIIQAHPTEKPIGADFDWQRLLKQVIEPLSQEQEGHYQRYDWGSDALAEWHRVPLGGIVIIEGVYTLREELSHHYDLKIWVDCPREIRLSRGIERDGEEARDMWEKNWMLSEDLYFEKQKPILRAELVVEGTS